MASITDLGRAAAGLHLLPRRRATWRPTSVYTKVVARRMIQMTRHINSDWQQHVAGTGVTCYTCHRGQPVPANIWFNDPGPRAGRRLAADHGGPEPSDCGGRNTSLPFDPFTPFLEQRQGHPRACRRRRCR